MSLLRDNLESISFESGTGHWNAVECWLGSYVVIKPEI